MSFIRCKKRGDKKYYYKVENKWVNGKVRQKVIKYLGTSPSKQRRRDVNDFEAYLIAETIMKHTPSREGVLNTKIMKRRENGTMGIIEKEKLLKIDGFIGRKVDITVPGLREGETPIDITPDVITTDATADIEMPLP